MELRTLMYFTVIAKEGSMTHASNALHVTQPTLSRQMKALEEELGVKLFTRSNYNIQLTEAGTLLKKRADEILSMSQKVQDEFKVLDSKVKGDVFIGCGETKGMSFISKIIKDIQLDYPDVHFHIYSGNFDDVTEKLDKGLLDFGILIQPANLNKYKAVHLPSSDIWGLIAKRSSELAQKSYVTREDLVNLPLICSRQAIDETHASNEFTGWFGHLFSDLNIVATFNLAYNAGLLVKENVGYAVTIDSIIDVSKENGLCFIPLSPKLEAKHNIIWRKNHTFSKASELFLEKLLEKTNA